MKKGWEVKKLGEVCEFDKTPNSRSLPYIGLEHIESNTGRFIGSTHPQRVKSLTFAFSRDHVLYGRLRPYLNKALVPDFEGHCSTEIFPIRVTSRLDRRFLFLWLLSDKTVTQIDATCTGARMPRANMNAVLDFEIPLPPLPEQKRIVGILDEAFAGISTGKENAEKNLQNARELFESYLQSVFANPGEGWKEKTLKEVGTTQTGTTPKTSDRENYGKFIPFIKPADINTNGDGEIRYDNDGLSEAGLNNGRTILKDSVLMVCIGASIGKVGFTDREVSCNQQINTLTVRKGLMGKFFYYALSTKAFFQEVIKNSAQATLPIINKSKWESLLVQFPESLPEQRSMVAKLDALSAETKKLEAIYQQKLADLDELKKSVLQKAFEGKL